MRGEFVSVQPPEVSTVNPGKPAQRGDAESSRREHRIGRCEFVQQLRSLGEIAARPRERLAVGRVALRNDRQNPVPQEITVEPQIGIAVVLYPLELALSRISFDFAAWDFEQRPQNRRREA
jgi:hypothetical protein